MKLKSLWSAAWAISPMLLLMATTSNAMPNFARKYETNCGMCHTQVPKLNRTGYEFRLAGYRLPDEIGKADEKFNFGDFFAARIQAQENATSSTSAKTGASTSSNQLTFYEATLYPLTGSWGRNFGSLVELSMAPGEGFEVENAYVRGVWGDAKTGWFTGKVGVMHPQEGFGASDRPLGNNRPLFQKQPANPGSPFYLWNVDEMALEAGYYWPKTGTNLSARISNGVIWKTDSSGKITDHADPAQGGSLTKNTAAPNSNTKNWQVVLNQYFNQDSGFTLYYYKGQIPWPDTSANDGPYTTDTYSRLAAYVNWFALPKLNLLAGFMSGKDSLGNPNINTSAALTGTTSTQNSTKVGNTNGYFLETDYHAVAEKLAFGARYDVFDPSKSVDRNTQKSASIFVNYHVLPNVQVIADLVHKTTEAGATSGNNTDNQFLVRGIFIF